MGFHAKMFPAKNQAFLFRQEVRAVLREVKFPSESVCPLRSMSSGLQCGDVSKRLNRYICCSEGYTRTSSKRKEEIKNKYD